MSHTKNDNSVILMLTNVDQQCMENVLNTCSPSQIDQIILTGTTPTPDMETSFPCSWHYFPSSKEAAWHFAAKGYEIISTVSTSDSQLISDVQLASKVVVIMGEVSEQLATYSDQTVHLPLHPANQYTR